MGGQTPGVQWREGPIHQFSLYAGGPTEKPKYEAGPGHFPLDLQRPGSRDRVAEEASEREGWTGL